MAGARDATGRVPLSAFALGLAWSVLGLYRLTNKESEIMFVQADFGNFAF